MVMLIRLFNLLEADNLDDNTHGSFIHMQWPDLVSIGLDLEIGQTAKTLI